MQILPAQPNRSWRVSNAWRRANSVARQVGVAEFVVDEAVWLDSFYFPCITPLFFTETLADLEKEVQKGRSPEDVVGNLAEKTPIGGAINAHHHTLSVNELLGYTFELRHVPVGPGGDPVNTRDGRRAVVYDSPPEAAAVSRWQEHDFLDVERRFAKASRCSFGDRS